jgi:sugar O-acyltransferase (sialic acid O-acetyltransferase NeuD family)
MKKGIIGAGGFGREIYWSLSLMERVNTKFFVDDKYWDGNDDLVLPISQFNPNEYEVVVAIANSNDRERIVNTLPKNTKYFTHIHPTAQIHGPDVEIGEGSIICAGTIITTNVKIGKHAHLNLITTVGHDCVIGDYFTTAPGVQISGNENIGNRVYFGTRSCVKQKITICDDVIVGMNAGVVNNITESGVYVGTPAIKKLKI